MSQQWSRISALSALMKKAPVGLDISDRTIEMVALSEEVGEVKIKSMSRALLPRGVVEHGRIKNEQKLAVALEQAAKNARPEPIAPEKIIFGIPEGQIYTRAFELGAHKPEDRDRLVEEEMKASIPLRKDEAQFAYSVRYESPRATGIVLIAVPKAVLAEWKRFFDSIKFKVAAYESETLAVARGLFQAPLQSPACIVDIGAAATTISIFSKQGLRYIQTLAEAGDAITLALSKELNIQPKEAESMKITIGLSDRSDKNFFIIAKTLETITARAKAGIGYFQEKTGERVERVVLIGGSAHLKGVREYFEENLTMSVWLGESVVLRNQTLLEYVEAAGLALRGLYPKKYAADPAFPGDVGAADEEAAAASPAAAGRTDQEPTTIIIAPIEFVKAPATLGQKISLLAILLAGTGGVFGASYLRDYMEEHWAGTRSSPAMVIRENGIQIFNETIQLAVPPAGSVSAGASAEIFEVEIRQASGYTEAVAQARSDALSRARQQAKELWRDPINPPDNAGRIKFPLRVQWLLYGSGEVADLLIEKAHQQTAVDIAPLSPHITVLAVAPGPGPNVFTLTGRIRVMTSQLIPVARAGANPDTATGASGPEAAPEIQARIVILPTDTGWLNARKGPGKTYSIVTRVHPGEKYPLLEERGEWYKIELGGETGLTAWTHSEYARKE